MDGHQFMWLQRMVIFFNFCHQTQAVVLLRFTHNEGYEDITKYLIEKGANIKIANRNGSTPLHLAADKGNGLNFYILTK